MMDQSQDTAPLTQDAETQSTSAIGAEGLSAAASDAAGVLPAPEALAAPAPLLDPAEATPLDPELPLEEAGQSLEGRERGEDLPPEALAQQVVEVATEYVSEILFENMGLDAWLLDAIHARGYTRPTPVQASAYPLALEGQDLIVRSKTGTGKTVAFLLPILARITPGGRLPQALILAPTRELALQVAEEAIALGKDHGIVVETLYGGVGLGSQLDHLKKGVDIVVGTPGRIQDHIRRRSLDLSGIRFAVLDEADEMLSMGFLEEVRTILKRLPEQHQTLLFSATVDASIAGLIKQFMQAPKELLLSADRRTVDHIHNVLYECSDAWPKARSLLYLLYLESPESAIIFCNTRDDCSFVSSYLNHQGFDAEFINSDLPQKERERVMGRIKRGELSYLVATDIAARGIDISDLSHVINYSLPEDPDIYLHRVGRTGRIGKLGTALSLVSGRDLNAELSLTRRFKIPFVRKSLPSGEEAARMFVERHLEQLRHMAESTAYEGYVPMVKAMLKTLPEDEAMRLLATALRLFFSRVRAEQAQGGSSGDSAGASEDTRTRRDDRRESASRDGDRGRSGERGGRRDDRGRGRDDRRRDDRSREDRPRDERPRDERPRDERSARVEGARGEERRARRDDAPDLSRRDVPTRAAPESSAVPAGLAEAAPESSSAPVERAVHEQAVAGQDRTLESAPVQSAGQESEARSLRSSRDGRDRDRGERSGRDRDSRDRDSRDRDGRGRGGRDRRSSDRREGRGDDGAFRSEPMAISLDDITCIEDLIERIEPLGAEQSGPRSEVRAEAEAGADTRALPAAAESVAAEDSSVPEVTSDPQAVSADTAGEEAPSAEVRDRQDRRRGDRDRRNRDRGERGGERNREARPTGDARATERSAEEAPRPEADRTESGRPRRTRLAPDQWNVEPELADLIESIEVEGASGDAAEARPTNAPRGERSERSGRERRGRDQGREQGAEQRGGRGERRTRGPRPAEGAEQSTAQAEASNPAASGAEGRGVLPVALPDLLDPLAAFAALNAIDFDDLEDEEGFDPADGQDEDGAFDEDAPVGEAQPGNERPAGPARRPDDRRRRDGRRSGGGGRRDGRGGGRRDGRGGGRGRPQGNRSSDGSRR